MRRILLSTLGLFVLVSLVMVPATLAQSQQQQQQPQQSPPDIEVSDGEVETIAEVYVTAEEIRESYRQDFQQAQTQEQARELQQQLRQEINAIIESKDGITSDRYGKVLQAAQTDDEVRSQLLAAIQAERTERTEDGSN